ncbi:hypothetical protein ACQKIE_18645 [Luteibacter sp. NPDC031894]|uniref:hypothetical protein n=1 Tax=Luteibacter sp. NPDC031894 TaxID=3390572 RepID=UPI003D04DC07
MKLKNAIVGMLLIAPWGATLAGAPVCCASGDNGKPSGMSAVGTTELGQFNPSVQNLSLSPEYQVFQFTREGIRYIEVADLAGAPRAAFTVVNGALLTLPIGPDTAQQVAISPAWTDVVYDDGSVVVARRTAADGGVTWQVYVK